MHPLPSLAFLGNFMGVDGLVILVLAFLIFGRKLPEMGKNLGKTIVEFKKGLNTSYTDDDKTADDQPEERPALKRPPNRISVNPNLDDRTASRPRRSLPANSQSEEV